MKEKKTPARGPIDFDPPPVQTLEQVQESWHKAKNYPPVVKKDTL